MKFKLITLSLAVAGLFSTSCLQEDYSDCYNTYKLVLSYKGDGATEIFPEKINRVDMYVFDEANACVSSRRLPDADVSSQTTTLPPLAPGEYRIICVGNAHDTGLENLESGDYGNILFAANDYLEGKAVTGNDSLYYASHRYTVEGFDPMPKERTEVIEFASSHYDILVEVYNAPEWVGKHPKIELVGVSPQTDFENTAKGKATDYIMETVHDGMKTTTAENNIMRHKNHEDVFVRVTGENGEQVAMINFAEWIEEHKKYIDPTKHECLIPFRIEFGDPLPPDPPTPPTPPVPGDDGMCVEISIVLPQWYKELISPIF